MGDDAIQIVVGVEAGDAETEVQPGFFAVRDPFFFRRLQSLPRLRPQFRRPIPFRLHRLPHPGRAEQQVGLAGQFGVLIFRVENVLGQLGRLLRIAVGMVEDASRLDQLALSGEAASPDASSGRSSATVARAPRPSTKTGACHSPRSEGPAPG